MCIFNIYLLSFISSKKPRLEDKVREREGGREGEREGGREGGREGREEDYMKKTQSSLIINHLFFYYRRKNLKLKRR